MDECHIFCGRRMRLPQGYSVLRPDLGSLIREKRAARKLGQKVLAHEIKVSRETLSRIERGKQIPRPQVLSRLIGELDLEWDELAVRGAAVIRA